MYKIILADDEPMIIRGLKKMLDWERLNASLAGEAQNGEGLYRLIVDLQPDIVISDIAMPVKSGLDVIRQIREEGYQTKVIFLTGFQEFGYAKSAVTYGAVDYLLKPVRKEELEKAILQAEKQLRKDQPADDLWVPTKEDELESIFQRMNSGHGARDIYRQFLEMGLAIEGRGFIGVCFSLADRPREEVMGSSKFELLRFTAFQKIQEMLKVEKSGFVIKRDEKRSNVIFILPDEYDEQYLMHRVSDITQTVKNSYKLSLHVGIGESVEGLAKLQYTYKTAMFTSELHYFLEEPVIWYEKVNREFSHSFEDLSSAYKQFVQSALGRKEEFAGELSECLDMIEALHFGNRYAAENRCIILAMDYFRELSEWGIVDPGDQSFQAEYEQAVEKLRSCTTYRELRGKLENLITALTAHAADQPRFSERQVIREVKEYIGSHYAQDISLSQIAQRVYMNPYYLSTFFKKETGQNFKDYLTQIRMKEAMRLLQEQDRKTYELAGLVGYKDVRSFTQKFRKYYGDSPSGYRKR